MLPHILAFAQTMRKTPKWASVHGHSPEIHDRTPKRGTPNAGFLPNFQELGDGRIRADCGEGLGDGERRDLQRQRLLGWRPAAVHLLLGEKRALEKPLHVKPLGPEVDRRRASPEKTDRCKRGWFGWRARHPMHRRHLLPHQHLEDLYVDHPRQQVVSRKFLMWIRVFRFL